MGLELVDPEKATLVDFDATGTPQAPNRIVRPLRMLVLLFSHQLEGLGQHFFRPSSKLPLQESGAGSHHDPGIRATCGRRLVPQPWEGRCHRNDMLRHHRLRGRYPDRFENRTEHRQVDGRRAQ